MRQPLTRGSSAHQRIVDETQDLLLEGFDLEHKPLWMPNPDVDDRPNPQRLAIESEADELFYGGAAGGGKSDLLLGLGFTRHQRSVIFRRVYPNLKALIDRSIEIVGDPTQYNRSSKRWQLTTGRMLEFGAMQYEHDKNSWQGQPHDYYGFDELPELSRTQYEFVITWNRTVVPNQRCRVVGAGNPPTDEAGSWVIKAWAPWLDDEFEDPAESGELRWYYRDEEDRLCWQRTPDPIEINGDVIHPRSRTFIPARLSDNPWLSSDPAYRSVLQSLPEPLRSQFLHGDFSAAIGADPWQVIPTDWVRAAQARWLAQDGPTSPLSSVGVDCARGGKDKTSCARKFGNWIDVMAWPGRDTRDGPTVAGLVHGHLGGASFDWMNVDVIGIGSSPYDSLKDMYDSSSVNPINAGAGSKHVDRSGSLKMRNMRAEYYWRMREALDPDHGDGLCLPPGNEVLADLCSARFEYTAGGVKIEPKEKIKSRIGRSPDVGEAIILSNLPPPADELEEVEAWVY